MDYKWHSIFRNSQNKVSALEVAFLLWMLSLVISWSAVNFYENKLTDLPPSIVNVTLTLAGTKVAHKLAENDWSKILAQIIDIFKKKKD